MTSGACPCGTGVALSACCGPLHRQERQALSAEELMRSRFSAFAVGDADHLFRTWHPRTRPADVTVDDALEWLSLQIVDVVDGGPDDETGVVEFIARYRAAAGRGELRERSRFARRAGRWFYLDGE